MQVDGRSGVCQAASRTIGAMNTRLQLGAPVLLLVVVALAAGCGGGNGNGSAQPTAPATSTASPVTSGPGSGEQGAGALTAEARQASAGDIPDNQVFLTFRNGAEGYSMRYPEGWAQRGSGTLVTFRDKNNLVRVDVARGSAVTVPAVQAELSRLKQVTPSLSFQAPTRMTAGGKHVVKVVYSTESAPSPVTGKRVRLDVDRYYIPGAGRHAVVDLGTPHGVDNVDAYRLMIESFQWK